MSINRQELKEQLKLITANLKEDRKVRCQKMSAKITTGDKPWSGMTAREIAQELGVSGQEVGTWVREGRVKGVRMKEGGDYRCQYFLRCDESGHIIDENPIKIKRRVNIYIAKAERR